VHPEVSFAALARRHLRHPKQTWVGLWERKHLLAGEDIEIPEELGAAGVAGPADVLDAAVAAWSATRIAAGIAQSLPEHPVRGSDGLVAGIWY
jgi:predicted RNase H-like nuclease